MTPWQFISATEQRLALVIGNADYAESPLSNPYNDANDMASVLEDLDFDVILVTDADRRQMAKAIRDFGKRLRKHRGVGLFYYAGHGMQLENRNYLIPVDAPMQEEDEVPYESIDVGSVLAKMQSAGNALNLLILDACRNNPFPNRFRSSNRGLARVDAPIGSLVVHATAPGTVAADGKGRNGTFTGHLIENLREPGLNLTQIVRRTRAAVVEETGGRQVPWESSSLLREYYLRPATKDKQPPEISAEQQDLMFWKSVQIAGTAIEYQAYLKRFPDGLFAELARARIAANQVKEPAAPSVRPTTNEEHNNTLLTASEPVTDGQNQGDGAKSPPAEVSTVESEEIELPSADSEVATQDAAEEEELDRRGKLTVVTTPAGARVRIMNIVEKYEPGISLEIPGEYDVLVSHLGYFSSRKTINLEAIEHIETISLEKKVPVFPEFTHISGGSFNMGCSPGDKNCEKFEKPSHAASLPDFAIASTEITVAQFRSFVDATGYRTDAETNSAGFSGCYIWSESGGITSASTTWSWKKGSNWKKPGYRITDNHPVSCVSWNDAQQYATWLGLSTGKQYRLPTEAEWEFAARAGTTTRYHFGNKSSALCKYANGADRSLSPKGSNWTDHAACSDKHWFAAPVASFRANASGLYDMLGNLREWVEDSWSASYSHAAADGTAYIDEKGRDKVLRGGAWESASTKLRVSARSRGPKGSRAAMIGFRLVEHN